VATQPHDGFITQWVLSFLPLQLWRILSTDSHPATSREYGSPHIVGFFFLTTNHTTLNGSTRWGSPLRPPPWAQSLVLTVVDSSRHTHGSASSPTVQGLVQDLNVYKPHGPWLSQWNLSTTVAFKMQWFFLFYHDKQTNTHEYYIHGFIFPAHIINGLLFPNQKRLGPFPKKSTHPVRKWHWPIGK